MFGGNLWAGLGGVLLNVAKTLLPSAKDLATIFNGNQESRDAANAKADAAVQDEAKSEYSYSLGIHRTWFDVLMDAVNRLPRPVGFGLVTWLVIWPIFDAEAAARAYTALALVPEALWALIILVYAFYYVNRSLEKFKFGPYVVPKAALELAAKANRNAAGAPSRLLDAEPLGIVSAPASDALMGLSGFGPGQLTRTGYTGRLPISRGQGWRNPIAGQYVATA